MTAKSQGLVYVERGRYKRLLAGEAAREIVENDVTGNEDLTGFLLQLLDDYDDREKPV